MTLKVGIVGCGFIGTVHSFALGALVKAGLVDAAVVSTFDVDPQRAARLAEPHGARATDSVAEVLDAVDAVWICTWTAEHRAVVAPAADRGLAVFCEKPLAPSLPECREVAGLLQRVPHQVGLVLRHAPVFAAAAAEVASGRHGRPLAAFMRDDQYFPIQGQYASEWRADVAKAGGGTLIEHSIHDVDVLGWILGAPDWVRADVANRFGHPGIDDVATLTLGYDDGTEATLLSVWHQVLSRTSNRRLEVFCDDALLWADDDHLGPLHIETSAGVSEVRGELPEWAARLDVPEEFRGPIVQYARPSKAFLDALSAPPGERIKGWPDAGTALSAHRVVDAAYRSAAAGGARTRLEE
jgi:predicted dehydrogenase